MRWLILVFLLLPIAEIWLIGIVGHALGFWPTLWLLIASGAFGAWMAKREGLRVIGEWQSALAEQRLPESGVLEGVLVLAGGVMMVAPGFLTDVAGLLLMIPPTRRLAARWLRRWFESRVASGTFRVTTFGGAPRRDSDPGVVQGRVVDDGPPDPLLPR